MTRDRYADGGYSRTILQMKCSIHVCTGDGAAAIFQSRVTLAVVYSIFSPDTANKEMSQAAVGLSLVS